MAEKWLLSAQLSVFLHVWDQEIALPSKQGYLEFGFTWEEKNQKQKVGFKAKKMICQNKKINKLINKNIFLLYLHEHRFLSCILC